jgi:hypothetical protein
MTSFFRWYNHTALWITVTGVLGVAALILGFLYFSLLSEWRLLNEGKHPLSEREGLQAERLQFSHVKLQDREQQYLNTIERLNVGVR